MIETALHWVEVHQALSAWIAGLSVAVFLLSLLSLPFLVALIPVDYFAAPTHRPDRLRRHHPLVHALLRLLKNLSGALLLLCGLLMLVLPGQGLLTMLMGLILLDFPGKYRLERRLAANPHLLGAINWLRRSRGLAPVLPPKTPTDQVGG
ncbi:transmembrane protein (PGPGW) [Marichromatium purpuratum 984]|uniref:Transmembrane protein (PGPGW) n=1 Tax=Marichromatium purpuratum 984 TaxID=765910 RepID=W0E053_MARPU|nr:PGPGW domain-containing protein [Marichromatium purpuratum]AHF04087.1 transmembrane protein (PGPGW) [Marichromatium purpuratum 984]